MLSLVSYCSNNLVIGHQLTVFLGHQSAGFPTTSVAIRVLLQWQGQLFKYYA
jgi:predicted ATPase